MDGALEAYRAKRHSYAVYAISAAPDGSGLKIEVANTAAAIKADNNAAAITTVDNDFAARPNGAAKSHVVSPVSVASTVSTCLLYTSDAADDLTRLDLGGRRIIKKKKN